MTPVMRLYDMRAIIDTIADAGSVLELREKFGIGIITAFIRVEGGPMKVIADNPHHLAGAIDSDGADKGARFMQLCGAFDRKELMAIEDPEARLAEFQRRTAMAYDRAKAVNAAAGGGIDDVIDPATPARALIIPARSPGQ
jgi:acetyl-CoA carboxylase carboxyltransferase component